MLQKKKLTSTTATFCVINITARLARIMISMNLIFMLLYQADQEGHDANECTGVSNEENRRNMSSYFPISCHPDYIYAPNCIYCQIINIIDTIIT